MARVANGVTKIFNGVSLMWYWACMHTRSSIILLVDVHHDQNMSHILFSKQFCQKLGLSYMIYDILPCDKDFFLETIFFIFLFFMLPINVTNLNQSQFLKNNFPWEVFPKFWVIQSENIMSFLILFVVTWQILGFWKKYFPH